MCLMNSQPSCLILNSFELNKTAILSKIRKSDNFESPNSLNLILPIFEVFVQILLNMNLSFNQTLSTYLDDTDDSGNFSVRGYLSLIWRDYIVHMHGLSVYVKKGLPFAPDFIWEILCILAYVFDWLYFIEFIASSSILLRPYARLLIQFHLTQMRFSRTIHLLMYLSLKTSKSVIRTD